MKIIEEKARAYDEAIKKAAALYKASEPMSGCNVIIETLFPELKESEDEKVIKEIIELVMQPTWKTEEEFHRRNVLCAWLENVPVTIDHEKREGFHLGCKAGLERLEMKTAAESLGVDSETYNKIVDECILGEQKPEDKIEDEEYNGEDYGIDSLYHAQRILEKTLGKVDGYQTDDGLLSHKCAITAVKKLYEQKPDWSEDDEELLKWSINNLTELKDRFGEEYGKVGKCIDWVKSLKNRVQPKPKQEWSEEDEQILQGIWDEILANKHDAKECEWKTYDKFLDWLKSLRPQNRCAYNPYKAVVESIAEMCKHYDKASHSGLRDFYDNVKVKCKDAQEYDKMFPQNTWKPSDEQIKVCKEVYADLLSAKGFDLGTVVSELNRLEEGLKKKGE